MPYISSPQSIQTQGVSAIAASNTTYTSGQVEFTGSGAATVQSSANQRVVVNVPVQSVQVVQSALAASNTTYTSGLVTITGVGGGVTVSSNTGQRIDISVAAQSVQVVQSAIAASNTTYTSGLVTITGVGGGVTVSSNTGQRIDISVAAPVAQSVQTQNVVDVTLSGNTSGALALVSSGTLTLAGGNNITLSQAGNAVTISGAAAGGAQTGISSIAASNTTYTSGGITITGSNMVTVRSTTGQGIVIDATQSVQVVQSAIGATNTTYTSGLVVFTGSNMITVKSSGAGQTVILDATQSVQVVQSAIAASNTTYTSGLVTFTGVGGGVTVQSNTGQRVDISVATPVNFSAGVSNVGNTAGATGVSGTRLVLVGTNNISLSQTTDANGLTVSISGGAGGAGGTGPSIVASNTTLTSGTYTLSASDGSRSAISIATAAGPVVLVSDAGPNLDYWVRGPMGTIGTFNVNTATTVQSIFPLRQEGGNRFEGNMTISELHAFLSYSATATSVSQAVSSTMDIFLYTRTSNTLSLLNSGSASFGNTAASTSNTGRWHGIREVAITATSAWSAIPVLVYGGEYYMGVRFRTNVTEHTAFSWINAGNHITAQYSGAAGGAAFGVRMRRPGYGWTNTGNTVHWTNLNESAGSLSGGHNPYIILIQATGLTN